MLKTLLRHQILLGLGLAGLAAWLAPGALAKGGSLGLERLQPWLVATIFLMSGLGLPSRALVGAVSRARVLVVLQTFSLLVLPGLAITCAHLGLLTGLLPGLKDGVLILACLPTTITSCVALTRAAEGDEALALVGAVSGSLLGVVLAPLLILLATGISTEAPTGRVITDLLAQTAAPLVLGQLLRLHLAASADRYRQVLGLVGTLCLVVIITHALATTGSRGAGLPPLVILGTLVGAVVAHVVILAAAWRLAAVEALGLSRPGRIAATLVAAQKSAALGVPMVMVLAGTRTDLGLICLPIVLYHAVQLVVAGLLVGTWKRWAADSPDPST